MTLARDSARRIITFTFIDGFDRKVVETLDAIKGD